MKRLSNRQKRSVLYRGRLFIAAFAAVFVCALCGCSAGSLENTAVIKAAAFDAAKDGGFTMTACVLNPEGEKPYITISADAGSMTEAVSRLASTTERKPFFSQCEVLIFSEELAKMGTAEITDWFYTSAEGNRSALVCVLKGRASDAFLYTEGLFKDPAVDISRTLKNAEESGGQVVITLSDAKLSKDSVGKSCLVPVCSVTGPEEEKSFRVSGAGVLREGALSGELTHEELLGAKCMLSIARGSSFTLVNGEKFGIVISRASSVLSAKNGKIECETEVAFQINEGAYGADTQIGDDVAHYVKYCIEQAFKKAQSSGDFAGLAAVVLNRDAGRLNACPDWLSALKGMDINVNVKASQRGGGYPPLGVF